MAENVNPLDTGGGGDRSNGHAGHVALTYAQRAGGGAGKRNKLNVLDIMLERKDNSINFNLNKEELSKLLFKKMKMDCKEIVKIDSSAYGKLHIQLQPNVKPDKFMDLPTFEIRQGLRTKFYRPHHRQDTLVRISWLDLETPDELIHHIFSFFGKIKSNIQYCKIKEEEGESDLAKLLNNIPNGERQFWIELKRPLPSYAVVDGRRVKIWHPGQKRTCARCNKQSEDCPGNSNAKTCEENGGLKEKTEVMWKELLREVNYKEWEGGEIQDISEETGAVLEPSEPVSDEKWDGLVIDNLKEGAKDEEILELLKKTCKDTDLENVQIIPTGSTRSKLIKGIAKNLLTPISKTIDKKVIGGNILYCRPHVPATPPEPQKLPGVLTGATAKTVIKPVDVENKESDTKQKLPGMPNDLAKPKKKKQTRKNKKKDEVISKKVEDMRPIDFLYTSDNEKMMDKYKFSETSDNDSDASEDQTHEQEPNDKFLTPNNFKSVFAARYSKRKISPGESERNIRQRSYSLGTKIPLLKIRPADMKKPGNSETN